MMSSLAVSFSGPKAVPNSKKHQLVGKCIEAPCRLTWQRKYTFCLYWLSNYKTAISLCHQVQVNLVVYFVNAVFIRGPVAACSMLSSGSNTACSSTCPPAAMLLIKLLVREASRLHFSFTLHVREPQSTLTRAWPIYLHAAFQLSMQSWYQSSPTVLSEAECHSCHGSIFSLAFQSFLAWQSFLLSWVPCMHKLGLEPDFA